MTLGLGKIEHLWAHETACRNRLLRVGSVMDRTKLHDGEEVSFRLVDVFTTERFSGNQLCVALDGAGIAAELMQQIACEIGFSETTFVTRTTRHGYAMRIFTPRRELPFAGHPSLGTAFALVSEGRVTSPLLQEVPAGTFAIEVDTDSGFAWMHQGRADLGRSIRDVDLAASALGLPASGLSSETPLQVVSTGLPQLMIPLKDQDTVSIARPDANNLRVLLEAANTNGVYVFCLDGTHARARHFSLGADVVEDPATGSAAGPLGAYLSFHGVLSSDRLTVAQGTEVGRPSEIQVVVERGRDGLSVRVGGGVVAVGTGAFILGESTSSHR